MSDAPNPREPGDRTPPAAAPDVPGPVTRPEPSRGMPRTGLSPSPPVPPEHRTAWGARLVVVLLAAFGGIAGYVAATRFLPRWWAHRIADIADGTFTAGISAGLFCGVLFTVLPLLVLRGAVRRGVTWTARIIVLVLAVLLAVPNLITLGIVVGTNSAAHAGERTFDVDAPGFRGATLAGAVVGVALAVGIWWLLWFLRRRRRQIAALEARLAEQDAARRPARPGATDADDEGVRPPAPEGVPERRDDDR